MENLPTHVGYIDLLRRNRSFRQLWLGQVVSQMGDWFDTIALYTIILKLTGSGRDVGLLLVARFVPSFFFGPISGVIADRFSRQRIMIVRRLKRSATTPETGPNRKLGTKRATRSNPTSRPEPVRLRMIV